jgi:hypothetical protein
MMAESTSLFQLGRILATPCAITAMEESGQDAGQLLRRHQSGDYGDICQDDWRENELSVAENFRIMSVYTLANGLKIWVITEADRSATTVLLPEEY